MAKTFFQIQFAKYSFPLYVFLKKSKKGWKEGRKKKGRKVGWKQASKKEEPASRQASSATHAKVLLVIPIQEKNNYYLFHLFALS